MEYVVGVDIGATNLRVALATTEGRIIRKVVMKTPREGDEFTIVNTIIKVIKKEFRDYIDKIKSIGIGTIGPVDLKRGAVINTPNIPIRNFYLVQPLYEEFKKRVVMANDCVAAAWGEYLLGAGKGLSNIVYITISTGIGGGMVINDFLILGKDGNGHEIGHIVVDVEKKMRCGCGGYGHWEAYGGGANIPKFAMYLIETWSLSTEEKQSTLYKEYTTGKITTELIYGLANQGDRLALKIVEEINKYHFAGIESIANIYDPELIVLGGSIPLKNKKLVFEPIKHYLERAVLPVRRPRIVLTPHGDDAVLIGAIALAINTPPTLLKFIT